MMKHSMMALAAAILLVTHVHADEQQRVGWSVGPAGKLDAPGSIELRIRFVNASGEDRSTGVIRQLSELEGLDVEQLAARNATPVRFRVISDAGTFVCTGTAGERRGEGSCMFAATGDFASQLEKLGASRPTTEEQLRMAVHGVRLEDVAALSRLGYRALSPRRLIDLRIFRVTPAYILQLADLGYRDVPLDTVVDLHMFRVTIADVHKYRGSAATPLSLDEVIDAHRGHRSAQRR